MRIPSGKTDIYVYFVAFATADGSRMTGLSGFTVYRSRNGVAEVAYTTPTITEIDATNMPGVYALLVDEDTTIASTSDSEEYCLQITNTGMEPVTRTIELYRRDTTSGQTIDVTSGGVEVATFQAGAAAEVNAEVVDALNTDAYAEPGQGAPGATISLAQKIGYLYKAFRNRTTQTAATFSLYADDGTTVDQKSTVSDDGTTATRGELVTGP